MSLKNGPSRGNFESQYRGMHFYIRNTMEFNRYGSPFILRFYQIHYIILIHCGPGLGKMLKTKAKFDYYWWRGVVFKQHSMNVSNSYHGIILIKRVKRS